MKKFLALLLSIMLPLILPVSALAEQAATLSESSQYEELLSEIDSKVLSNPEVLDGVSNIPIAEISNLISQYDDSQNQASRAVARSHGDTAYVATILSVHDGISTLTCDLICGTALIAKEEAENYQNSSEIEPYRHSTWNFRCGKNSLIGIEATRIFTINFEWGFVLYDRWNTKYWERYDYYYELRRLDIALGNVTVEQITLWASNDASDYICAFKDELEYACKYGNGAGLVGYQVFKNTFTADSVKDFWNNKEGRLHAANVPSLTPQQMYEAAKNAGNLIMTNSDVGVNEFGTMWNNTNWWAT